MNEYTRYRTRRGFRLFLRWAGLFLILFILIYGGINLPALWNKATFQVSSEGKKTASLPKVADITPTPNLSQVSVQQVNSIDPSEVLEGYLVIPKIDISVPIIWESSPENIMDDLQRGVAHFKDTAHPGQDGNVFISGHSSFYWWDPGQYKTIFSLLSKLDNDDLIYLRYNQILYVYQVYEKFVVNPNQTEVLNPVGEPIITLMTCTPVGTNYQRLIIRARQVNPDPKRTIHLPDRDININLLPAIR